MGEKEDNDETAGAEEVTLLPGVYEILVCTAFLIP